MSKIEIFNHSQPDIGYVARTSTQGDEFEMVNKYIEHLLNKYQKLKKKKIAIFIEPQIDTGYPDIVIVEYYNNAGVEWNEIRSKLSISDFKILFQIQKQKNAKVSSLIELLGFTEGELSKSLNKLSQCGLIHLSEKQDYVRNVQLHSYSHINKIVSIEAKINKWSEAIQQASKNVWFSTESYILMNKDSCNDLIVKKCAENGVGIILVNGVIKTILKSEHRSFPVSYTSLLFNEWIHRKANCQEENI